MSSKAKRIAISILVILTASFFVGLLGGMQVGEQNYGPFLWWGLLGIAIAILLGLVLGVFAIAHFRRTKGTKGIFIGILILLVLIPLVFAGTCALSVGGDFVRRLFVK